jgi:dTDP-4-dehydrorhamnose 3,5-epimerase
MKVQDVGLEGVKLVELVVHGDERGFFTERFNEKSFTALGLPVHFKQDNHSRSAPGVVRGLHYQTDPWQGKLVGCVNGKIWDVVVDIRPNSPTFGQHFGVELSDLNGKLLWIPAGFAHGFCVLGEKPADVLYKVDQIYNPEKEGGIQWNDPDLKIPWPLANPVVSNRDKGLQSFSEFRQRNSRP